MKDCKKKTCCEMCKKRKLSEGKTLTSDEKKKVYEESKLKPYH